MNPIRTAVAMLTLVLAGAALAAEPPAAPTATPVKHPSLKSCNREATVKKLNGRDREQYVKDCTAGKAPAPPAPTSASH
jgi:ribosomal protein L12E/L44/L45/RPP1/RPP2